MFRYYLRANPDVAAAGINPVVHYALAGQSQGRSPQRAMDAWHRIIEAAKPKSAHVAGWLNAASPSGGRSAPGLREAIVAKASTRVGLVVAVGHDDYSENVGGVQNVIRDERDTFERKNWGYLYLFPAVPLPVLAPVERSDGFCFGVRLGRDRIGFATAGDLTAVLVALGARGLRVLFVVHHLLGHSTEVLGNLAQMATDGTVFWVHDYFSICANYNLLRNDVLFCGAPPSTSTACAICVYRGDRQAALLRMETFFQRLRPHVLSPSSVALELWRRRSGLTHSSTEVQPYVRLIVASELRPLAGREPGGPWRVAHLGMRLPHKGWPVFGQLAARFRGDPRFSFFQLGVDVGAPLPEYVRHIYVKVGPEGPNAMIEAIAEHRIDVVVSWSPWPETFCYAAYEALAAGAYVLARAGSGNVEVAIASVAPRQGMVLPDEVALFSAFEAGLVEQLGSASGRRYGALIFEGGAAAWLTRQELELSPESLARPLEAVETDGG